MLPLLQRSFWHQRALCLALGKHVTTDDADELMVEQMNKTQAILFDMDGVLIDSEELHAHAKRTAFLQAGITLTDSDLRDYVGRSDAVMIEEVATRYQLSAGQRAAILREKAR